MPAAAPRCAGARSAYVGRLRRAFLLRVHPDRFAAMADGGGGTVQRRQAVALVQALGDRLAGADFARWQRGAKAAGAAGDASRSNHVTNNGWFPRKQQQQQQSQQSSPSSSSSSTTTATVFPFCLEKRDGTLLQTSIDLNSDVEAILEAMASALRQSGAAPLPPPPPATAADGADLVDEQQQRQPPDGATGSNTRTVRWNMYNGTTASAASSSSFSGGGGIDHRYDVHSRAGRSLVEFLRSSSHQHNTTSTAGDGDDSGGGDDGMLREIERRRRHRTDAQAVALRVRRLYKWSAVDATHLGWSSQSVAVLLRRLLALHAEYHHCGSSGGGGAGVVRDSYHPLRLQFSPRENADQPEDALDVHGGTLRLNPASTTVQWLDALQLVTTEKLEQVRHLRCVLQQHTATVQRALQVKLQKGFTCPSRDYHACLERLAAELTPTAEEEEEHRNHTTAETASTSLPMLEPVTVVIESDAACRRPKLLPHDEGGGIRLGAGMAADEFRRAARGLREPARERVARHRRALERSRAAVRAAQWQLGLQRVYRLAGSRVTHEEFAASLGRLLQPAAGVVNSSGQPPQPLPLWKHRLSGNSLGIAAAGHFCHLADDGSIVIPHNWT